MKASRGDSMSELELLDMVLSSTSLASDVYFGADPRGAGQYNPAASGHEAFPLNVRASPGVHMPAAGSGRQWHGVDFPFYAGHASHVVTNAEHGPAATDTLIESVRPVGATDE